MVSRHQVTVGFGQPLASQGNSAGFPTSPFVTFTPGMIVAGSAWNSSKEIHALVSWIERPSRRRLGLNVLKLFSDPNGINFYHLDKVIFIRKCIKFATGYALFIYREIEDLLWISVRDKSILWHFKSNRTSSSSSGL